MEKPIVGMKGDSKAEDLYLRKDMKNSNPKKPRKGKDIINPIFFDEPFFGKIPEPLLKDTSVSLQAKCIFAIYHLHANQKRLSAGAFSFPSQKRIADDFASISVSYLKKLVKELRTKGWITSITLGLNKPNIIVLHKVKNEKIDAETRSLYKKIVREKWRENSRRTL